MRKYLNRIISFVVLMAFLSGQSVLDLYARENLATSVISNDSIDPYGNHIRIKEDIARLAKPSAVGKGPSLVSLLQGKLPERIVKVDIENMVPARRKKIRNKIETSINHAILKHLKAEKNKLIPIKYRKDGRAASVLTNLVILKARLKDTLFLYKNSVENPDDYLLGFSIKEIKGFAIELVEKLSIESLAQFIYHECVPEYTEPEIINGKISTVEHKQIYKELQSAVFNELGKDRVSELGEKLNAFIVEKISKRITAVINGLIKDQKKVTYASIAKGLGVSIGDIKRWKIRNEDIGKVIIEAGSGEEYRRKRFKHALISLNRDNIKITPSALAKVMGLKVSTIKRWMADPVIKEYIRDMKHSAKQVSLRKGEQKEKEETEAEAERKIKDAIKTIFDFPGTNKIWLTTVLKVSEVDRKYRWKAETLLAEASKKRVEEVTKRFLTEGRDLTKPRIIFDISDEAKVPYSKNYYLISSAIKRALEGNSEISAIGNGPHLSRVVGSENRKRLPSRLDPDQIDEARRISIKEKILSAAKRALEKHNTSLDQLIFPSDFIFDTDFKVTEIE